MQDITAQLAPCSPLSTSVQWGHGAATPAWRLSGSVGRVPRGGTAWPALELRQVDATPATTALKVCEGSAAHSNQQAHFAKVRFVASAVTQAATVSHSCGCNRFRCCVTRDRVRHPVPLPGRHLQRPPGQQAERRLPALSRGLLLSTGHLQTLSMPSVSHHRVVDYPPEETDSSWSVSITTPSLLRSTFRQQKGGRRLEDCSACPAGYFCPHPATVNPRVCGAGSYSVSPSPSPPSSIQCTGQSVETVETKSCFAGLVLP